jgi:fumarylpyruvate hydrolase
MRKFAVAPPVQPVVPVSDGRDFPVRRIFCIGRNYADHVSEMGGDIKSTPPTFFIKPADAVFSGGEIPWPMATKNLHFEGELVVALKSGGQKLSPEKAVDAIFGFAAGCDLTRRDLQTQAKQQRGPWDAAKAFDSSAGVGVITPADQWQSPQQTSLRLLCNGEEKQKSSLLKMIWSVPEIIVNLSGLFELKAGDLIFTGTPSGVGPMTRGDTISVEIDGLNSLKFQIAR